MAQLEKFSLPKLRTQQAHGVYVSCRIFLLKEASPISGILFYLIWEKRNVSESWDHGIGHPGMESYRVLKQRNAIRGTNARLIWTVKNRLCDQILNLFYFTFIIATGDWDSERQADPYGNENTRKEDEKHEKIKL